ncbi:hypothetical protein PVAP13_1KG557820 [Panicum virgatum]|uniref:Uncharacterized protein n=1 Tax=Panicum virgatum TaxID=38727 RepID=A0A8T0XUW5_PANVG|nr:hypothetical protein PVAP13_1KG557820 [Panicum virgatum]
MDQAGAALFAPSRSSPPPLLPHPLHPPLLLLRRQRCKPPSKTALGAGRQRPCPWSLEASGWTRAHLSSCSLTSSPARSPSSSAAAPSVAASLCPHRSVAASPLPPPSPRLRAQGLSIPGDLLLFSLARITLRGSEPRTATSSSSGAARWRAGGNA